MTTAPHTLRLDETVNVALPSETREASVKAGTLVLRYPILKNAIVLATVMGDKMVRCEDVCRVGDLFQSVNERFPGDSFGLLTVVSLLRADASIDSHEMGILHGTLPDRCGEVRVKVRASEMMTAVEFCITPKHTEAYYVVRFSHPAGFLGLPIDCTVRVYTMPDDVEDDNDAEPVFDFERTLKITENDHKADATLAAVKTWIEAAIDGRVN